MKKTVLLALLVCAVSVAAFADDSEHAAIVAAVDQAYVHGVHIDRDVEKMRAGMHDSFVMFVRSDKGVTQTTRDAWIERLTPSKPAAGDTPKPAIRGDITVLDRVGNAAVVKVDLFRDDKQIFTDYISLYRFDDGWKLVAKTFHRH